MLGIQEKQTPDSVRMSAMLLLSHRQGLRMVGQPLMIGQDCLPLNRPRRKHRLAKTLGVGMPSLGSASAPLQAKVVLKTHSCPAPTVQAQPDLRKMPVCMGSFTSTAPRPPSWESENCVAA